MKTTRREGLRTLLSTISDLNPDSPIFGSIIDAIAETLDKLGGDWYSVLTEKIDDTSTYIYVADSDFPNKGLVKIDNEFIAYQRDGSALKILQRGCVGTSPSNHEVGTAVVEWLSLVSQLKEILRQTLTVFAEGDYLTMLAKDRGLKRVYLSSVLNDPTLRRVIQVLYMNRGTLPIVREAMRRLFRFDYPRLFVTTHPTNYEVLVFIYPPDEAIGEVDKVEAWEDDPQPLGTGGFYLPVNVNDTAVGGYFANDIDDDLSYDIALYLPSVMELTISPTLHTSINDDPDYYPDLYWILPYGCGIKFINVG